MAIDRLGTVDLDSMDINYETLVEELRTRSSEEKEDIRALIDRWLVEERREELLTSYRDSRQDLDLGALHFSKDIKRLKSELSGS